MRTRGWRRIATAVWGWPRDPQIYGKIDVDAVPLLDAIERVQARTGVKVSVTDFAVRGIGRALADNPDLNTRLRFGRFVPRTGADVFVIVSTGAGLDLSGVKVRNADRKDVITVARAVNREAREVRAGERTDIERGKHLLETLPLPLLRVFLRLAAFLTVDLGWDLKKIGLPREAFGSAMVSSVGMFGITDGYSPLSPLYRVPFIIVVGQVRRAPWVEGDKVVVRPVLPIGVSIDHRWVDGHQIARLSKSFREYLDDPLRFEPAELAAPRPAGGKQIRATDARG